MKTPEEIKKGLDMCIRMAYSDECPYFKTGCRMGNMLMRDALSYIKQLEAQVPRCPGGLAWRRGCRKTLASISSARQKGAFTVQGS